MSRGGEGLFEFRVNSEARSGVGQLAEEGRREL
jgi:hypothetical protein